MTTTADDIRTADRRLRKLAKLARQTSVTCGSVCPDCGSSNTEDNGCTEYRCCACDHRWGIESGERYGF